MNVLDLENKRAELAFRLDQLIIFLQQKAEQTVRDEQLDLLYRQYAYMQGYMNILNKRIRDLGLGREL